MPATTDRTLRRRHVTGGMGAALMAASPGRAIASPDIGADIEQRLARLKSDGRVSGVAALP